MAKEREAGTGNAVTVADTKSGRTFRVRPLSSVPISNLIARDQSIRSTPSASAPGPRRRTVVKAAAATAVLAPSALAAALPPAPPGPRPPSCTASPPATRCPTASCCGPGSRPTPEAVPGSGLGPATEVGWEVAADKALHATSSPPARPPRPPPPTTRSRSTCAACSPPPTYWYRFSAGGAVSPVGRTRTAPAADAAVAGPPLRRGLLRQLGGRLLLRLPAPGRPRRPGRHAAPGRLHLRVRRPAATARATPSYGRTRRRTRSSPWPTTAPGTASTRPTPTCRPCTPRPPVIAIWDDHEIANDTWSGGAENHTPGAEGTWAARPAAAKQAYFEWMPVAPGDRGHHLPPAALRQARRPPPARPALLPLAAGAVGNGAVDDPERTLTGRAQLDWLKAGLAGSDAAWKLVGNSVMISPVAFGSLPARPAEAARRAARPARRRASPSTPTSGTATRTTAGSCSPTCGTTRSTTPSS